MKCLANEKPVASTSPVRLLSTFIGPGGLMGVIGRTRRSKGNATFSTLWDVFSKGGGRWKYSFVNNVCVIYERIRSETEPLLPNGNIGNRRAKWNEFVQSISGERVGKYVFRVFIFNMLRNFSHLSSYFSNFDSQHVCKPYIICGAV